MRTRGRAAFGRPSVQGRDTYMCTKLQTTHAAATRRKWQQWREAKAKEFRCASFRPYEF